MSRPAQMKSTAAGQDEEGDLSEDDKFSSLILLCCSRKNKERGEGWQQSGRLGDGRER